MASCYVQVLVSAACPSDIAEVKSRHFSWPRTPAENQIVDSNQRCDVNTERRGYGIAQRVCKRDFDRVALWEDPEYIGCGEKDSADLDDLAQTPVVADNVENVAEALVEVTDNVKTLTSDDIENVAATFENIVNVDSTEPEVTSAVVSIVDNLVDLKQSQQPDTQTADTSTIVDILESFEAQIIKSTEQGKNISVQEPNIVLKTTTIQPNQQRTKLSFAILSNNDDGNSFDDDLQQVDDTATSSKKDEKPRVSISFPSVLFDTDSNETIGVSIIVHNSDALFPSNLTNQSVSGDIIAAILTGVDDVTNLSKPIELQFTAAGLNPVCVFWDFNTLSWSPGGCEAADVTDNKVLCHCYHLTNFAVLVDATYEDSHIILDIVSKVGCGLSLLCLLFTLVVFLKFRRLRSGNMATSRKILMQFCLSLFLLYFVFLVGIDQTSNRVGCILVAFLLHFLTLTSLSWMGVEAYHMYLNVVRVFDAIPENFVFKSTLIAWGMPLVVASICLGAGSKHYSHLQYCFISNGNAFNYGLVLPVAVILLYNTIIFARVLHGLLQANLGGNVTRKSKTEQLTKRLQNAFAISVLMGLTWIFGFFAIEDAKFAFSLLFCICNSFQGVIVFILFCIRQEDVKKTLQQFVQSKIGLPEWMAQSKTASTRVVSSTSESKTVSKNIYSDMDFSQAKTQSPYSIEDFTLADISTDTNKEHKPMQQQDGMQILPDASDVPDDLQPTGTRSTEDVVVLHSDGAENGANKDEVTEVNDRSSLKLTTVGERDRI